MESDHTKGFAILAIVLVILWIYRGIVNTFRKRWKNGPPPCGK